MMNGWYCRSITSDPVDQDLVIKSETSEEDVPGHLDHRLRYKNLKKKLKYLIYENEFLMDTLRTSQHSFLKVAKDRSFLLDRLLQYEKPEISSSESNEDTDTSDEEETAATPVVSQPLAKKKKIEMPPQNIPTFRHSTSATNLHPTALVKKKPPPPQRIVQQKSQKMIGNSISGRAAVEGSSTTQTVKGTVPPPNIMTTEEVERHLQSRQSLAAELQLRAPPTVPTEMFSNEPSLDSEGGTEDCLGDMGLMHE